MGKAVERYQYGSNTWFNVMINPAFTSRIARDPVLSEMDRLFTATGQAGVLPNRAQPKMIVNGQQLELTNEQVSDVQYYTGTLGTAIFTRLIAAPIYAALPDEQKAILYSRILSGIGSASKIDLLGNRPDNIDQLTAAALVWGRVSGANKRPDKP
jgi:hypothetical protein